METNLKRMIARCVSIAILLFSFSFLFVASAADFYVTPTRAMRVPKIDRRKCRNLDAVLRIAETNDTIHLATGTYNLPRKGFTLSTPVTILGGYSTDFKTRDPFKMPTCIAPTGVHTARLSHADFAFFNLDFTSTTNAQAAALFVDGLTFDGGAFTNFTPRTSRVRAAALFRGENVGSLLALTIRNCTFLNSYGPALQLNWNAGSLTITNNVFSNNWPFAVSLAGPFCGPSIPCDFTANTLPTNSLYFNFGLATNCAANIFTAPTMKPIGIEEDEEPEEEEE